MHAVQYEACQEALQLLESTPDAQGRQLRVYKVQLPPNLFLGQEEASALVVSSSAPCVSEHYTSSSPLRLHVSLRSTAARRPCGSIYAWQSRAHPKPQAVVRMRKGRAWQSSHMVMYLACNNPCSKVEALPQRMDGHLRETVLHDTARPCHAYHIGHACPTHF